MGTSADASVSASVFFGYCLEFISSISLEQFSVQLTIIIELANKIINAAEAGVSISSQMFQLIYIIIINSLQIFISVITIQIQIIESGGGGSLIPPTGGSDMP